MPRVALPIALLILVLALTAGASQAAGGRLACGERITKDTKLDRDLINCPSNGIVIGADNVTLDLNGHVIAGDGTEFSDCPHDEFCDVGVANDGHQGLTVRDGSIRGFGFGVLVFGARDNRLVGISSSKNTLFGAVFGGCSRSVVRGSSLSRNVAPKGDGIGLFGSDHIRIIGNSIQHNPGPGIHVSDSADNLIEGNLLTGGRPAVLIEGNRNEVRGNRVIRGAGILVNKPGNRNVIAGNRVSRAFDSIAVEKGRHNLVARNLVARSDGAGIRLGVVNPTIGGGDNVVRRNEVKRSGEDGFLVEVKDDHSVLEDNIAIDSADDGFDIESSTTELIGNRAVRSAGRGFER
jgi:parallel beta-helix repeat protein